MRNVFWTLLIPGIVTGYVPWRVLGARNAVVDATSVRQLPSLAVVTIGVTALLACVVEFVICEEPTFGERLERRMTTITDACLAGRHRGRLRNAWRGVRLIVSVVGGVIIAAAASSRPRSEIRRRTRFSL